MKELIIDPKVLAERTKDSSRTVSLRIKEKTWLGFEQLAKENNTTANSLISELADYYIESLTDSLNISEHAVRLNKFKTSLDKEVRKICRWSIDQVVMDFDYNYIFDTYPDEQKKLSYLAIIKKVYEKHSLGFINHDFSFCTLVDNDILAYPTEKTEASYFSGPYDPRDGLSNILYTPIEKAPDVFHIFKYIKESSAKNEVQINYDIETMDKIVKIINDAKYDYSEENFKNKQPTIHYNNPERRKMLESIVDIVIQNVEES